MQDELTPFKALTIFASAALLSTFLIVLLRPLLARYVVARPNQRSSHKVPTPQGGGFAVLAAMIVVSCGALYFFQVGGAAEFQLTILLAAIIVIAGVGVLADNHPENVVLRLLLQAIAVSTVIFTLPPDVRVLPIFPLSAERVALLIGGLWFINLVNFMDGLDWMTVSEVVPITTTLAIIGFLGMLPSQRDRPRGGDYRSSPSSTVDHSHQQ
jgi:UDP-N-acetylmuramyl pentapeptide phosphotransferase/UDP-N-acetylglucosamine-1-phosphate transferase